MRIASRNAASCSGVSEFGSASSSGGSGNDTRSVGSRGRSSATIASRVIVRNTRNQTPIRRRAGAVDDYLAAVTMISTSRPGKTSCGDTTHARTGALSGSTHSFHASLWASCRSATPVRSAASPSRCRRSPAARRSARRSAASDGPRRRAQRRRHRPAGQGPASTPIRRCCSCGDLRCCGDAASAKLRPVRCLRNLGISGCMASHRLSARLPRWREVPDRSY